MTGSRDNENLERSTLSQFRDDGNTNPKKVNEKKPLEGLIHLNIYLDKWAHFLYEKVSQKLFLPPSYSTVLEISFNR